MKKFIVMEDEKIRIINLHKKLIAEQSDKEVEGEVSLHVKKIREEVRALEE
jgi:hypothetical protein